MTRSFNVFLNVLLSLYGGRLRDIDPDEKMASFSVRPYCNNARRDRCQLRANILDRTKSIITASPSENWRGSPGWTSSNYVDEHYPTRPEV